MKSVIRLLLVATLLLVSCEKETPVNYSQVAIDCNFSTGEDIELTGGEYVFKNVNTGAETKTAFDSQSVKLQEGLYNISFLGEGVRKIGNEQLEESVSLQGVKNSVQLIGATAAFDMDIQVIEIDMEGDFVLREFFLKGSIYESGKQYNGDQYFVIHNNSNKVLYADSLMLIESRYSTSEKFDYTPNLMSEAMTAHCILMIPGNGTQYPIEPGESFTIADNAMDHREINDLSFDLSNAMFEWHSDLSTVDINNPKVPNLYNIYLSLGKFWVANKQGTRAYSLARKPSYVSMDEFYADYMREFTYNRNSSVGLIPMRVRAYIIPNEWIVDAVNLSPSTQYEWGVVDSSLDLGYASLSPTNAAAENNNLSVQRKIDEIRTAEEAREILIDTNNSSNDFTEPRLASKLVK